MQLNFTICEKLFKFNFKDFIYSFLPQQAHGKYKIKSIHAFGGTSCDSYVPAVSMWFKIYSDSFKESLWICN